MKSKIVLLSASLVLVGCARFSTHQTDMSYEQGTPQRQIETKAAAWTFFSGKSSLANWKATQTDKTQGASVGTLIQEGGQTNQISDIIRAAVEGAVIGASKVVMPIP